MEIKEAQASVTCVMRLPKPGFGDEGKSIPTHSSLPQYLNEFGVTTDMSQYSQLNLAIISCNQETARASHKGIPDVDVFRA